MTSEDRCLRAGAADVWWLRLSEGVSGTAVLQGRAAASHH